ncbi:HET-domain-containing protein [Xylariaceae sp. AK1471]|nr:HET-domain-containing protein [Xylariaceae sp. AK1471]
MRLIDCQTLALEEFLGPEDVVYAILSHTWKKHEEVQYSEFTSGLSGAVGKGGFVKIMKACQLALSDGCNYAWVDTCCIDKSSSAELSEAINSMFLWYSKATICYAYLDDFDDSNAGVGMSKSRWFTRGWTLQELIAPPRVRFYDMAWNPVGMRDGLSQQLSDITGIEPEVLLASPERHNLEELLSEVPVARRMSWAAKRDTTRREDTAYCLLGIFGVNLLVLYGEGDRAFIRLQEEIVKNTNDLSLLAWRSTEDSTLADIDRYCGAFASHPQAFQRSSTLVLTNHTKFTPDFTMTNKGLKIDTPLAYYCLRRLHILMLNCHDAKAPQQEKLGVFLKHQGAGVNARARPHVFASESKDHLAVDNKTLFLSKHISPSIASSLHSAHRCSFTTP